MVSQLAVAVMLVTVGGLVVRTATAMAAAETGFDSSGLIIFSLAVSEQSGSEPAVRRQLGRSLESRLRLISGVVGVAALDSLPAVSIEVASPIEIDGAQAVESASTPWAYITGIDADALTVLGVPILRGRPMLDADMDTDGSVVWISAQAATRYFGGVDAAIGRRLRIRSHGIVQERQIVGITGDARYVEPERGMPPRVWLPLSEPSHVNVVVRASGDVATIVPALRLAVREAMPGIAVEELETYDQAIARRAGSDRVIMGMLTSFAAVALLFAATGLYGIVAFSANQRLAEFGTRFALGAQIRDVAWLVIGQAFRLLALGLTLGIAGGLATANSMRSMLYGVTPLDPLNIIAVISLLTIITLAASLMPAWRAARVDITDSLRS